jgi:tetratricopeptide (TPR) repeat protein
MRDVCEALQYMHELEDGEGPLDLIHRDLSPDNVILSTSGAAKLIDFGAARATARTPPARVFVGKYRYAAPERIRQQGEDARSDVYSAGVVLYECLTGVRPFEGPDAEVIQAIVSSRCCDPRIQVPSLPDSVADLVCKATAGNPADRFASARELGTALAHCLAELKASSKERDVTLALTAVLEEVPAAAPAAREPPEADAVPEAIEAQSSLPTARLDIEDALCEVEILEASGPIRKPVEAVNDDDTVPVRLLPEPAEAVPVASSLAELNSEAVHGATPTVSIFDRGGERRLVAPSDDSTASEEESSIQRAVDLFDRGLELRAQGRYGEALDAWERALSLAPENQVYQSNVRRLREQLHQLRTEGDELAADTQRYDLEDAG